MTAQEFPQLVRWACEQEEPPALWLLAPGEEPRSRADLPEPAATAIRVPAPMAARTWLQLLAVEAVTIYATDPDLPDAVAQICAAWQPLAAPRPLPEPAPAEPARTLRSRWHRTAAVTVLAAAAFGWMRARRRASWRPRATSS